MRSAAGDVTGGLRAKGKIDGPLLANDCDRPWAVLRGLLQQKASGPL